MMFDQAVEQRLLRRPPHQPEFQRAQIFETGFDRGNIDVGDIRRPAAKEGIVRSDLDRWQLDMSAAVQRQHQPAAFHPAWRAIGLDPIPYRTQFLR